MDIDISGLDEAEVLRRLYDNATSPGLGAFARKPGGMSLEEARALLDQSKTFDYVRGRVLKVGFRDGVLRRADLYDRDNGEGAAQRIVDEVRRDAVKS